MYYLHVWATVYKFTFPWQGVLFTAGFVNTAQHWHRLSLFFFFISWNSETQMLPLVRFETCCNGWGARVGTLVTVVPTSFRSAVLWLQKTILFLSKAHLFEIVSRPQLHPDTFVSEVLHNWQYHYIPFGDKTKNAQKESREHWRWGVYPQMESDEMKLRQEINYAIRNIHGIRCSKESSWVIVKWNC